MPRLYLSIFFLVTGILIGYILLSDVRRQETGAEPGDYRPSPFSTSVPAPSVEKESAIFALRQELQQEIQAREELQAHVEMLQLQIEDFERERENEVPATADTGDSNLHTARRPVVRSSIQALIDAGISEEQAVWIQERLDDAELQQLYLRDRATREGWLNKPRYHRERQQYMNAVTSLRGEVDDDVYDRLLYTLGRANRVVVRDTMQNSIAAQYGLQSGDQIVEYAGQRIFNIGELSALVSQGESGVMTLVKVKRDGEIYDIYLPRGPLGIRMNAARIAP